MKFTELPTPCYLLDENRLVQNLAVLRDVARRTGAKILLAQKAFSMFSVYPLIREYLAGTTASGLYEARLGHEEFGGETHVYAPAYAEGKFLSPLLRNFWSTPTTLCSTRSRSGRPTAALPVQQGRAAACGSIRSAPRSRATTRCMTRAVRIRASALR